MPRMYAQGCWLAGAWKGKDGNTVFNKSGTADELRLLILTPVRIRAEFFYRMTLGSDRLSGGAAEQPV